MIFKLLGTSKRPVRLNTRESRFNYRQGLLIILSTLTRETWDKSGSCLSPTGVTNVRSGSDGEHEQNAVLLVHVSLKDQLASHNDYLSVSSSVPQG